MNKINEKLNKEQYTQFKVALHNFHAAKKNSNMDQKVKYYKVLRSLFSGDLEFFCEIEKFINFTGNVKEQPVTSSLAVKRKLGERD